MRRTGVRLLASCLLALSLAACGFRPLYAPTEAREQSVIVESFDAIEIAPLPERAGQVLRNHLLDRLSPRGAPDDPAYRLNLRLTEQIQELGIRTDETATRANLRLFADFQLVPAPGGPPLLTGQARSVNSYDVLDSQFATSVSEADARDRGLRELANEIRERLAIYFSRKE